MKLLIADDEMQIRTGLSLGIDWQEIGIDKVITAQNGVEALELCRLEHPQIIITDIRMPGIDGLELSKQVCKLYSPVKIIILSGFSEFEYAKEAIKIGAIDYLLKPINIEDLVDKVKLAQSFIQTEIELGRYEMESLQSNRIRYIKSCLKNKVDVSLEELMDTLRKVTELTLNHYFFIGCVGLDTYEHELTEQVLIYLMQNLQIVIDDLKGAVLFEEEEKIFFIIEAFSSHERKIKIVKLKKAIETVNAILSNQYQVTVSTVVSNAGNTNKVIQCFEECSDGINHRLYLGKSCFVDCENIQNETQVNYMNSNIGFIQEQIKRFSREGALEIIRQELESLKEQKVTLEHVVREICIQQKNILLSTLKESGVDIEGIFEYNISLFTEIPRYVTIDEYCEWISNMYDLILKGMARWEGVHHSKMTIKAMDFISQNYNKDIRLEQVANYVSKSKNYFSALFKKELGISFIDYLNQVRIEKAMYLLRTTDKYTYEISEEVGFSDYKYFSSVFKKATGVSPNQFRRD